MHTLIGVDTDVTHREGDDDGHILEASVQAVVRMCATGKTREVFPLPRERERERERGAESWAEKHFPNKREEIYLRLEIVTKKDEHIT